MMNIRKILIVGAGTMGAGIAQVTAENGFEVILLDQSDDILDRALSTIKSSWSKIGKGQGHRS